MAHRTAHRHLARTVLTATVALLVLVPAGSALACGGLITPNGTVSLLRTTTLAAYHAGVEHYVTSFEFAGADATEVGSIVPLPGVPTKVIKGGDWTLQRLILETEPPEKTFALAAEAGAAEAATVLLQTQIDALDITVLEGGAVAVGNWASDHGFFLPPDAPEVLEFYAERSPIFMAVKFDVGRANDQGVQQGQGTPVHVVIPTPNPWVPLRILALGRQDADLVQADVYLLTDVPPATLPLAVQPNGDPDQRGLIQEVSEPASSLAARRPAFGPRHEVDAHRSDVADQDQREHARRDAHPRSGCGRERVRPAERGGGGAAAFATADLEPGAVADPVGRARLGVGAGRRGRRASSAAVGPPRTSRRR